MPWNNDMNWKGVAAPSMIEKSLRLGIEKTPLAKSTCNCNNRCLNCAALEELQLSSSVRVAQPSPASAQLIERRTSRLRALRPGEHQALCIVHTFENSIQASSSPIHKGRDSHPDRADLLTDRGLGGAGGGFIASITFSASSA